MKSPKDRSGFTLGLLCFGGVVVVTLFVAKLPEAKSTAPTRDPIPLAKVDPGGTR